MPAKKPLIHCDALVVHCMDYRLQKFIQPWIKPADYSPISKWIRIT